MKLIKWKDIRYIKIECKEEWYKMVLMNIFYFDELFIDRKINIYGDELDSD